MNDKSTKELWIINVDGTGNRKLTNLQDSESQASWSNDGTRIAFVSKTEEGSEIHVLWKETGAIAVISQLNSSPSGLMWSPDDTYLAYRMFVSAPAPTLGSHVSPPKGAKWAKKPRITTRLNHESDGKGYLKDGFTHIFLIPAEGGKSRQCTFGEHDHGGGMVWMPDNKHIVFSANLEKDHEYQFRNSNIYRVNVETTQIKQLTANDGPEHSPKVSKDGKLIGYLGFDDKVRTYQVTELYVMKADGSDKVNWTANLDRGVKSFQWNEAS